MTRTIWRIIFFTSSILFIFYLVYMFTSIGNGLQLTEEDGKNTLPIPQLLEDTNPDEDIADFTLKVRKGTKEFFPGKSTETYGYNGDFLGPLIRVKRGEKVNIKVENQLGEPTTVHWHGLEVPGEMDGGPHSEIDPGSDWQPHFTIDQPAATLWYHPHLLHKTGEQVYKGLAGLFYIEDQVSESLNIPKEYGVNDIPLIVQDKRFDRNGNLEYDVQMPDLMQGYLGDTVLVNGAITPSLEVNKGKMRFRILNGSNARIYNFHLSDYTPFFQIASDGGFLQGPVKLTELKLSSAERAEIIVDFSNNEVGDKIELQSNGDKIMTFIVKKTEEDATEIPKQLTTIDSIPMEEATVKRVFEFRGMGPMVNINGKQYNLERIDENVKLNATEIWEIRNETRGMGMGRMGDDIAHPFHAHGIQFQVIERDGESPPLNERGWKDTILVYSGETVKTIARFKEPGLFMYHCHILEHEDAGMMGQFLVGQE